MHAAVHVKLVALRVTAEVIVIVENQNARAVRALAKKVRGREPADSAAHDNEIVRLARVCDRGRWLGQQSIAQRVRSFERSGMTAAHAETSRRIVAPQLLRRKPFAR
jgi:hypothetical protein